ncbi:hypothetical protein GQ43DRAFT_439113 [Delitschia confertaspora ATCC 74209]|uniref:Uncharacterized protein n=1 Tax=Delitschia confertaspora ATCC 74209 TaxID=1513339 RepID=A0A9P4MXE3_9PLEO|nr:hypothetical protein GQ43DRAFT_439113 [Delitschia confertaspora ATCC 74209]
MPHGRPTTHTHAYPRPSPVTTQNSLYHTANHIALALSISVMHTPLNACSSA